MKCIIFLLNKKGVIAVEDLPLWSISEDRNLLTAHLVLNPETMDEADDLVQSITNQLKEKFGISHSTIQCELEKCDDAEH